MNIELHNKNDKFTAMAEVDGKIENKEFSLRDTEIDLLKSVFMYAFRTSTDLKKSIMCQEAYSRLLTMSEDCIEIALSTEQAVCFKSAWEKMAENRSGLWIYCMYLLKQLD